MSILERSTKMFWRSFRHPRRHRRTRFAPTVDTMEARTLLATALVTNSFDSGLGSLRNAVMLANRGVDVTIKFAPSLAGGQTITLTGELTLNKSMTIDGGSNVTISGNDVTRIFLVNSMATAVNIDNLTITQGLALGNSGTGGDGQGGAIYNSGTLTLVNDTISNSVAQGGAGANGAAGAPGAAVSLLGTPPKSGEGPNGRPGGAGGSGGDGEGGAIYNTGVLTITHCTLSGNEAIGGNGGNGGNGGDGNNTFDPGAEGGNGGNGGSGGSGAGSVIFNAGTLSLTSDTIEVGVLQGGNGGNGGNGGASYDPVSEKIEYFARGGAAGKGGVNASPQYPGIQNTGTVSLGGGNIGVVGQRIKGAPGIPGQPGLIVL